MPTDRHHGVRKITATDGARALSVISTAVIGLVSVSTDADAAKFPLNTPVLVTDLASALTKAGVGLLKTVLTAIAAQASPVVIIVRVAEGANAEATEDNVVAGLDKLLAAESALGFQPRIIGAPGLETAVVSAKLAEVAQKLHGFGYAGASLEIDPSDFVAEVTTLRESFDSRELMLLYPDWKSGDAVWPAAAVALGLRAQVDQAQGWNKTISNVAVSGVTGVTVPMTREEADLLNDADVTACINRTGFKFWGNRTTADDPKFAFETATRTDQVLGDTIEEGMAWAVDRPITRALIRDILETVNNLFRSLARGGYILGAEARFIADDNPVADLQAGKLRLEYEWTDTPPLEDLAFVARKTSTYLGSLTSAS